ncbi:MAG: hypothetical protein Q9M92_10785 [Enterobacterales bacterium]|nr:hypothetical protein [Enterobacterales bacterium]
MLDRLLFLAQEESKGATFDSSKLTDRMKLFEDFIGQFITLLPNIINFLLAGSSFLGIWLIYRGIRNSIRDVSYVTPDMKRSNLIRHIISGMFLLSIPFHLSTLSETFFVEATDQDLATAIDESFYQTVLNVGNGNTSNYFYSATLAAGFTAATMILGLFAFIRGFYLISQREENGSMVQKETSASSIATHIIGGFILTQLWRLVG